jgi:glyoxylase-like metal-dependent hydrolase (beta-lactamase superfamily II)
VIVNLAAAATGMTSNAFLLTGTRPVLVDPGSGFDVVSAVREHVDDIDAVVLTHTHPDHVGNVPDVVEEFGVDVWGYDPENDLVDHELDERGTVRMGDHDYEVLHTPGHKDDHVCLYAREPGVLFAGDLVFANGGFGRTDLAEGDRATLVDSIERVLAAIDNLEEMYTGHGPAVLDEPRHDVELALRAARMGV